MPSGPVGPSCAPSWARSAGTHRAELRAELGLARIVATDAAAAAFADLGREVAAHTGHPERAVGRALPACLPAALDALATRVHTATLAQLAPALRRIATVRRLDLGPAWPALPPPRLPLLDAVQPAAPVRAPRLAGAAEGLAVWRVAFVVLAAMPLVGLPVLGRPRARAGRRRARCRRGRGRGARAPGRRRAGPAAPSGGRGARRRPASPCASTSSACCWSSNVRRRPSSTPRSQRRRAVVEAELLALTGPRAVARA